MARVDLYVANTMWTVGDDDFLHSLFSTVAYQLEHDGWASRFPAVLRELFDGRLPASRVAQAREELATIRAELAALPPAARVYDYDDPNRRTPWPIPPGAATLADCFLNASGTNMLDVLDRALDVSAEAAADVEIRPSPATGPHAWLVRGEP